jgi:ABC-type multidrug transport system ATPase subunit
LIFLDEPTAGIDPVARRDLWDLLFELAGQGKTLFVTTHYMDEAERCNDIAYIYLSRLMVKGTPSELKALPAVRPEGTRRVAIASDQPSIALMTLKHEPYILDATLVEAEIHVLMKSDVPDSRLLEVLDAHDIHHGGTRPIEPSLEDVFVTLTRSLSG